MTNVLTPTPKQQFFGNDGRPAVGYKLFTYEAGTSTKLATYPNGSVSVPNSNPVILDYRGEANIWIPPNLSYKFVLASPTDTDPPGNPIWSVDNLVNNQLLTLYGGVDSGVANAYVLTFDASFDSYSDGIIIYFVAANSNTGASTLNVNGLGPVSIKTQGGAALSGGEIIAGVVTQVMYKSSSFVVLYSGSGLAAVTAPQNTALTSGNYILALTDQGKSIIMSVGAGRTLTIPPNSSVPFPLGTIIDVECEGNAALGIARGSGVSLYKQSLTTDENITIAAGSRTSVRLYKYSTDTWVADVGPVLSSFTVTLTGVSGTVTGTAKYRLQNGMVALYLPILFGTSNSTSCGLSGIPAELRSILQSPAVPIPAGTFLDNSANANDVAANILTGGTIQFMKNGSSTGFTSANNKGFNLPVCLMWGIF